MSNPGLSSYIDLYQFRYLLVICGKWRHLMLKRQLKAHLHKLPLFCCWTEGKEKVMLAQDSEKPQGHLPTATGDPNIQVCTHSVWGWYTPDKRLRLSCLPTAIIITTLYFYRAWPEGAQSFLSPLPISSWAPPFAESLHWEAKASRYLYSPCYKGHSD